MSNQNPKSKEMEEVRELQEDKVKKIPRKEKLTIKEKRFVNAYATHGNATQAYIDAGYSYKDRQAAGIEAYKIKNKPKIQRAVDERLEYLSVHTAVMSKGEVLEELSKVAWDDEVSEGAKLRALELLGKSYGLFSESKNTETTINIKLTGKNDTKELPAPEETDQPTVFNIKSDIIEGYAEEVEEDSGEFFEEELRDFQED